MTLETLAVTGDCTSSFTLSSTLIPASVTSEGRLQITLSAAAPSGDAGTTTTQDTPWGPTPQT